MFEGHDHMEIIALVKDEARVFSFVAREEDEKPINELALPEDSRVMFLYRDEKFMLPEPDSVSKAGKLHNAPPRPFALGEGNRAAFRQVLVYAEPMRVRDEMTSRGLPLAGALQLETARNESSP